MLCGKGGMHGHLRFKIIFMVGTKECFISSKGCASAWLESEADAELYILVELHAKWIRCLLSKRLKQKLHEHYGPHHS